MVSAADTWGAAVGTIAVLRRFPVKGLAGEVLERAPIVKSGVAGDRAYAFVKPQLLPFPWFTARDYAPLLRYRARYVDPEDPRSSRVEVTTPAGTRLDVGDPALLDELSRASGTELRLLRRGAGLPDSMRVSLIARSTVDAVAGRVGQPLDPLRFRPNLLVETVDGREGAEDAWVGGVLRLGDGGPDGDAPILAVVERDTRCVMVDLNPSTAAQDAGVLKEIGRSRGAQIGVYASVVRPGTVTAGAAVYFRQIG